MKKRLAWLLAAALLSAVYAHALAEEGPVQVDTWDGLRNAINTAPDGQVREIQLTDNVECPDPGDFYKAGPISVGQGKIIVLNLNGHTVDRGLYKGPDDPENLNPHSRGSVIQLYGGSTLTVRDSTADPATGIGNGKITGGYGSYTPGGVMVMCEATFILESGVIEGNSASRQYGGGVHIMHQYVETLKPGTFIMKSGAIRNNVAENDNGGGVNVGGTFEMLGGEITGNRTEKRGGGVWVENCGVMILGAEKPRDNIITVKITGNTRRVNGLDCAENVFLSDGSPLGVLSRLSTGTGDTVKCEIGVTSEKAPTAEEPALITNTHLLSNDESYEELDCFISDNNNYEIGRNGNGQVVLGVPVTLRFAPGEGFGSMEPQHELGGIPFLLPGSAFEAPAGKGFDCWQLNETNYEAYGEITLTADATATALYGDPVSVVLLDGSGKSKTASVIAGKTFTLPSFANAFDSVPENQAFRGWKIGDEDEIRDPGYTFTVNSDTSITAQWNDVMTWTQLRKRLSQAGNGETIRLYNDVVRDWRNEEEDAPLVPPQITISQPFDDFPTYGTVTLDLNGHTVDRCVENGKYGYVIETSRIHLIITDTSLNGEGKITGGRYFSNSFQTGEGGGILVGDESTVTLKAGSISGNMARYGGGVLLKGTNAKFNLEGGSIANNLALKEGGGAYLYQGVMTVTGGEITENHAGDTASPGTAGAIMASAETKLRLFGGRIYGNKASNCGSVWIDKEAELFVQGAPEMICELDSVNENRCDVYLGKGAVIRITDSLFNDNPIDVIVEDCAGVITGKLNGYATAKNFAAAQEGYMTAPTLDDRVVIGDWIDVSFDSNGAPGTRDPEKAVRGGVYILPDLDRYAYSDPFSGKPYGILWPNEQSFNGWLLPGEDEPRAAGSAVSFDDDTTLTVSWADTWGMLQSRIDAGIEAGENTITLDGNVLSARTQYGSNISVPLTIPAGADVVLDLNGFEIDRRCEGYDITENGYAILVKGRLTIRDSSADSSGRITGGNGKSGGAIHVAESGELLLQSGGITGNASQFGGGVYVEGGRFTMAGGRISGNECLSDDWEKGPSGGGVYVSGNGEFVMTGGTIAENSVNESGGGVCLIENASMTIGDGAVITKNSAGHGGGVFAGGTSFAMQGGEISYNEATGWGNGGGVYLQEESAGAMSGGIILGNRGSYGGGVRADGSFAMSGGQIIENTSDALGGGVYVQGIFTVSGNAKVTDNSLNGGDCNVYLAEGTAISIGEDGFAGEIGVTTRTAPTAEAYITLTQGYEETGSTGIVNSDSDSWRIEEYAADGNAAEIRLCAPVILSFDPGPGTGSMESKVHSGRIPFILPPCTFDGPDGGKEFDKWIIGGESYSAGDSVTLIADATALAVYRDYEPGDPINRWNALANALADGGYVTLAADIAGVPASESDVLADLLITKPTTLDLAGHILTCKAKSPLFVGTESGTAELTILDSNPGAVHEDTPYPQGGMIVGGITLANSSALTLSGGSVIANGDTGVAVGPSANFAMRGGRIERTESDPGKGYGVSVAQGGSLTLSGGYILGFATGIRNENATATLSGGYIQENAVGVENVKKARLTLSGSVIGEAKTKAGKIGVINSGGSSFIMSGGAIHNVLDSVFNDGAEIYESGTEPLSGAEFTMTGGTIHDAGGILVQGENAVFTLKGGTITRIRKGGLVPAAVFAADGGTFAMAGGEIRDSSLAAVAVGTDRGLSAQPGVFSLADGTIRDAFGSLAEGEPSSSVVIGSLGSFAMDGGHIIISKESESAPDRAVSVLPGASFMMTGGEIAGDAETGVAVDCANFEMAGGTVGGKTSGVTVSGADNAPGDFILAGGFVSGCGETGVAVSKNGEFVLSDGGIRNNPKAVAVRVLGGRAAVMGGAVTNNKVGILVADGSCTVTDGMVAGHKEYDADVLKEGDGSPRFGVSTLARIENVRLADNAVIHIDGLLETDARITVYTAAYSLGRVITSGLRGNGTAAQFRAGDESFSMCADENGEAVLAYGVFFDTEGGTPIDPQYILEDGKTAVKPADPALEGAKFLCWYAYGKEFDFDSEITGSITLKAIWRQIAAFRLPASVMEIRPYAFSGVGTKLVELPAPQEGVTPVICDRAFADCGVLEVVIPAGWIIEEGADPFDGCNNVTLFGPRGGAAEAYANEHKDICAFYPEEN